MQRLPFSGLAAAWRIPSYRQPPTTGRDMVAEGAWAKVGSKHYRHVSGREVKYDHNRWLWCITPAEGGDCYSALWVARHEVERRSAKAGDGFNGVDLSISPMLILSSARKALCTPQGRQTAKWVCPEKGTVPFFRRMGRRFVGGAMGPVGPICSIGGPKAVNAFLDKVCGASDEEAAAALVKAQELAQKVGLTKGTAGLGAAEFTPFPHPVAGQRVPSLFGSVVLAAPHWQTEYADMTDGELEYTRLAYINEMSRGVPVGDDYRAFRAVFDARVAQRKMEKVAGRAGVGAAGEPLILLFGYKVSLSDTGRARFSPWPIRHAEVGTVESVGHVGPDPYDPSPRDPVVVDWPFAGRRTVQRSDLVLEPFHPWTRR